VHLTDRLTAQGTTAMGTGLSFEVTDHDAMLAAVSEFTDAAGGVDVLVNNAVHAVPVTVGRLSRQAWKPSSHEPDELLRTGQTPRRCMIARGRERSSTCARCQNKLVRGSTAPYAAAKAWAGGLSQVMCASGRCTASRPTVLRPGTSTRS